jgi:hypothetical protein
MKPSLTKALRFPPLWVPSSTEDFLWLDTRLALDEAHGIALRLVESGALPSIGRTLGKYKGEGTREKGKARLVEIIGCVLGNALYGFLKEEKPVAYSRSNPRSKQHPYADEVRGKASRTIDSRDLKLCIDALEDAGFLDNYKAPQNTSLTLVSMFRATPKLVSHLRKAMPFDIGGLLGYDKASVSFVTLRDFKPSDIRLAFGETVETRNLEALARNWASVNAMHRTTHPDEKLFRWEWFKRTEFKFRGDFLHLGRFYHQLSEWPLEKRKLIEVEGVPTVEYDFKALHINLLYANFTKTLCKGDAYAIPSYPFNVDRDMGRRLAKVVANVGAINSPNIGEAVNAINGAVRGYPDKDGKWIKPRRPELREWCEAKGIHITKETVQSFVEYHKEISEYLFDGHGLVLQRMDSAILRRVLLSFVDAAMWIVPFHDSFRVQVYHEAKLINEMRKAFKEETGLSLPFSYITKK